MKKVCLFAFALLIFCFSCNDKSRSSGNNGDNDSTKINVQVWLTDPDAAVFFKKQEMPLALTGSAGNVSGIEVNDRDTFQTMDGFGYTLTGGSAMLLGKMSANARATILKEMFATDANDIGTSYLRVSIGASDLDEKVFSYNDLPDGQTDVNMEKFSLEPDKTYLIPVLKEVLAIYPDIKILGSPWSPPVWMKTNKNSVGGSLKPEYYDAYAKYFVKYIQGMKAEGITIDAITIQNEPLHPGNNPSLLMQPLEQADFIKQSLGPALKAADLSTKIILYDHNADRPDYPITILNDAEAAKYVDGSAFHLYAGDVSAISQVHDAHPDKHLYFTEQWIGAPGNLKGDLGWHIKNVIIGTTRNWCKTALEWNLAADKNLEPHTPGGCTECLGALTIEGDHVTRNPAYYVIAHAAKFVRPGSVRIASGNNSPLPNVAFKTPDNKIVLIVLNDTDAKRSFGIAYRGKTTTTALNPGAAATYIW
ncbi:MAG: glucosylceramidase [Chitinophagaceae bacterium]|nr:glucosylceramidase [Chitinophagaceae bacterium]